MEIGAVIIIPNVFSVNLTRGQNLKLVGLQISKTTIKLNCDNILVSHVFVLYIPLFAAIHDWFIFLDNLTCGSSKENSRKRKREPEEECSEIDDGPPTKKFKGLKIESDEDELETSISKQNEEFHMLQANIQRNIPPYWQEAILKDNGQVIPHNKNDVSIFLNKKKSSL